MKKMLGTALVAVALSIASVSTVQAKQMRMAGAMAAGAQDMQTRNEAQMALDQVAATEDPNKIKVGQLSADRYVAMMELKKAEGALKKKHSEGKYFGFFRNSKEFKAELKEKKDAVASLKEQIAKYNKEISRVPGLDQEEKSHITGIVIAAGTVLGTAALVDYMLGLGYGKAAVGAIGSGYRAVAPVRMGGTPRVTTQ